MNINKILAITLLASLTVACGSSNGDKSEPPTTQNELPEEQQETTVEQIQLNQVGFLPNENKVAVVPNVSSSSFALVSKDTGTVVFEGTLSTAASWQVAGDTQFKIADFSPFKTEGQYFIRVAGVDESHNFDIGSTVFDPLHDAALKSYYFNRSGTAIEAPYSQQWTRAAGHSDEQVKVHASAASTERPELTVISSPKGWYDAGDYGKYVVNSGITTYTLLAAYEHFPDFYDNRAINIPETDDLIPDILNETLWNIDWLATMQDPDGGVYHKLTTLNWPGQEMPDEDKRDRYVIGKSTAATLNFAAVLAMSNRVYQPFDTAMSGKREQWLAAAESAWSWAVAHPMEIYQQPADVSSGEYGDSFFNDEFAWAAAELFITTKNIDYFNHYLKYRSDVAVPSWSYVAYLATSTLLFQGEDIIDPVKYAEIKADQLTLADKLVGQYQDSSYKVPMIASDFVWGSNSVALNKALILMQAHKLTDDQTYREVAINILDYVLGRNPTDYSFVTGFGSKSPMFPHHRISDSDGIAEPIPGMVAGGPHSGRQDGCNYLYTEPARTYIDDWCSFATNEIAINWNAPLVYVLAALLAE
ncbi:glycoside hydrolase family 9 protein [Psychrosphaera sp. B3R10]|uniref:glycoside hydrolase family 9 protein n=1 Tax=unclassified Psychrosphaera TaxID=2641570 RepID=UPI001C0969F6|nr:MULTISPECIES: glycoside hydrolase family 9 protein [unclassified Psychrosphaera]MBU2883213.1 glycoside hydrolase family 9 protein [Psychrosphaera sp. I2R16]MBU2988669.1 glycoside hydrolase family 9 protein [Psychrosphaera sp. B3R10]